MTAAAVGQGEVSDVVAGVAEPVGEGAGDHARHHYPGMEAPIHLYCSSLASGRAYDPPFGCQTCIHIHSHDTSSCSIRSQMGWIGRIQSPWNDMNRIPPEAGPRMRHQQ